MISCVTYVNIYFPFPPHYIHLTHAHLNLFPPPPLGIDAKTRVSDPVALDTALKSREAEVAKMQEAERKRKAVSMRNVSHIRFA